jgi:hypothetical protein
LPTPPLSLASKASTGVKEKSCNMITI